MESASKQRTNGGGSASSPATYQQQYSGSNCSPLQNNEVKKASRFQIHQSIINNGQHQQQQQHQNGTTMTQHQRNFTRPAEINTGKQQPALYQNPKIAKQASASPQRNRDAVIRRGGGLLQPISMLNDDNAGNAEQPHSAALPVASLKDGHKDSQQLQGNVAMVANNQADQTSPEIAAKQEAKNEVVISQAMAAPKSKQIARDLRKLQSSQAYSQHYEFQSLLGEGAFCTVYRAIDKETNEEIAVKVIKRKTLHKEGVELLKQEAELLQSMDHKNIVKFKHFKEIKGKIFLGMELMRGGQLSQLILARKRQQKDFSDDEASLIIKSIFEAVHYLHSNEIVHRDLKPDNILIGDPEDFTSIKVADFGLSAKYEQQNLDTDQVGTLIFMSPELIKQKRYSPGVDVFASGIVMYMLLTGGQHPLFKSTDFMTEKYKRQLLALDQLVFPEHLSPLAANLFHRLTKFNLQMRYTAHEALRHPWITRLNKTLIPMTLQDKIENMQTEHNFRTKIGMMLFLSNVSHSENYFENSSFLDYKKLLCKVTNKIEKWYDKRQCDSELNHKFSRDEDYVELDQSPSKFGSTDDEQEDTNSIGEPNTKQINSNEPQIGENNNRIRLLTTKQKSEEYNKNHSSHYKWKGLKSGNRVQGLKASTGDTIKRTSAAEAIEGGAINQLDISAINKRNNGNGNFQSYLLQAQVQQQYQERSPGVKKSTTMNYQTPSSGFVSPRKRSQKKKQTQQLIDAKGNSNNSTMTGQVEQSLMINQNSAGARNNYNNSSFNNQGSQSQEKSYVIQKPIKSGSQKKPQSTNATQIIRREDIILSAQKFNNNIAANSPKAKVTLEEANQSSNVYSINCSSSQKQIGDYYYQTPYHQHNTVKAKLNNGVNSFQTEESHSQSDRFQRDHKATRNHKPIVGQQANDSFEMLYKSQKGGTQNNSPETMKKAKVIGASLRSQEFANSEYHYKETNSKASNKEQQASMIAAVKPLAINLKAMRRISKDSTIKQSSTELPTSERAAGLREPPSPNLTKEVDSPGLRKKPKDKVIIFRNEDCANSRADKPDQSIDHQQQQHLRINDHLISGGQTVSSIRQLNSNQTTLENRNASIEMIDREKNQVLNRERSTSIKKQNKKQQQQQPASYTENFSTLKSNNTQTGQKSNVAASGVYHHPHHHDEIYASNSSQRSEYQDLDNAANSGMGVRSGLDMNDISISGGNKVQSSSNKNQRFSNSKTKRKSRKRKDKNKDSNKKSTSAGVNNINATFSSTEHFSQSVNNNCTSGMNNYSVMGQHAKHQYMSNDQDSLYKHQHYINESSSIENKQKSINNRGGGISKYGIESGGNHMTKDGIGGMNVGGHLRATGFNNTSITHHQQQAANRLELERKRNSSYDQKFLFKKNFISKYQPGPALPVGQIQHNVQHNKQLASTGKKHNHHQNHSHSHHQQQMDLAKRFDGSGIKVKGSGTKGNKGVTSSGSQQQAPIQLDPWEKKTPVKISSQPPSFRPVIPGIAMNSHNNAVNIHQTNTTTHSSNVVPNDLPIIEQGNNNSNNRSKIVNPMFRTTTHSTQQNAEVLKSGSAQADRSNNGENTPANSHKKQQQYQEDLELTAVRHRIGNILSSNHVLDETNSKDFFKKESQNNPFMLTSDSGLAPPPNFYVQPASKPETAAVVDQPVARRPTFTNSQLEQSSEGTVLSRNKIEQMVLNDMKSNTQKLHKTKAQDFTDAMYRDVGSRNNNNRLNNNNHAAPPRSGNQNSESRTVRKKSSQKLNTGGKQTDSTMMPHQMMPDFVPQHLDHRQSQQIQPNILSFGHQNNHQSQQQRTQSNPNNRVTAFIKIQHMPAEVLLQQQKQQAPLQNANTANAMRGHHFNAMMAQQRTSEPSTLAALAATNASTKMSPYGNSSIKSWGRPVKAQFQQDSGQQQQQQQQQLLNIDKSLVVTDSTKLKKDQQLRQMSIARNVQQMGNTNKIPFTRKGLQKNSQQQYDNMGPARGVLEPKGDFGVGANYSEKSSYLNYSMNHNMGVNNQITVTQISQPQALTQLGAQSHESRFNRHSQINSQKLNEPMQMNASVNSNNNNNNNNPFVISSNLAHDNEPQITGQQCDSYQNQAPKADFGYGRQNSDQTAYMRNIRSVLHHNGLQQKNNFINIGTQQLSQQIVQPILQTQHQATQQQQQQFQPQPQYQSTFANQQQLPAPSDYGKQ